MKTLFDIVDWLPYPVIDVAGPMIEFAGRLAEIATLSLGATGKISVTS